MDEIDISGGERPNDLGYFIGYRVAQSYYDAASDKHAALVRLLTETADHERCVEFLRDSGYAQKMAAQSLAVKHG